jgi:hypothetical protein
MQALKNHPKNPDFNKNPEGNLGILFFMPSVVNAAYSGQNEVSSVNSDTKISLRIILRKLMSLANLVNLVNLVIILSNHTNFPKFSVLR